MFGRGIERKTPPQLAAMRAAGRVVADALAAVADKVRPGVTTAELDRVAADVIAAAGARPSFLGYLGYPATVCVSVDDEVIHGIPGPRILRAGQVVSIDCGAAVDGWHGDAAITVPVGEISTELAELSEVTRRARDAGIAAAVVGARVGEIGAAVEAVVRSYGDRYDILTDYVGHGIGSAMHQAPDVPNLGPAGRGPRLREGMVVAIEPMVTLGPADVRVQADDWTVVTVSGRPAAHWEHTVAITPTGPQVLTA